MLDREAFVLCALLVPRLLIAFAYCYDTFRIILQCSDTQFDQSRARCFAAGLFERKKMHIVLKWSAKAVTKCVRAGSDEQC
jgi:hypothetical protein